MTIPSAVKTFLFLTVSASALGAVIHFESTPARAAASVAAAPTPRSAPAGAPPAIDEVPVAPPAEAPAPAAASAAPSRAVAAPDLVGKRLSVARRVARKLGLAIVAHDGDGLRIEGDQFPDYRVRRQSTPAGTSVEPGATVEVRVREIRASLWILSVGEDVMEAALDARWPAHSLVFAGLAALVFLPLEHVFPRTPRSAPDRLGRGLAVCDRRRVAGARRHHRGRRRGAGGAGSPGAG